jgi:hypothetical protein
MAFVLKDRVKDTTTTTGTGTVTLSGTAPIGYVSFLSAIGNGNNTYYTITAGSEWEVGIGTLSSNTLLSRDTVLASSNAGSLVNFSAGTKDVFVTYPAGRSVFLNTDSSITIGNSLLSLSSTGVVTSPNLSDATGYKSIPQNAQTAQYTLAFADMGKHISITTGGILIPGNTTGSGPVAFPVGTAISIYNNSGSNQTIAFVASVTDTLYLAGTATTGSRTLAQRGVATLLKVTTTAWVISGAGVS